MRGAQEHSGCGPEQIEMGGEVLGGLWFNVKDRQKPKKNAQAIQWLARFYAVQNSMAGQSNFGDISRYSV